MDNINKEKEELEKIHEQILKYRATELMNDRERAVFLGLTEGCRIRENAKILAPENLVLGKNVWIGEGAILDAMGGLEIGDFTQIGLYCLIWSHSSHMQALIGKTAVDKKRIIYKKTTIGKNTFIAGHSVISCGVTIGNNVIVAPMSFVEHDIPDNTIYSNNRKMEELGIKIASLEEEINFLKNKLK